LHWDVIAMGAKCWLELIKMNEGTCHKQRQSQLLTERPGRPTRSLSAGACPQDKTTSENEKQAIANSREIKKKNLAKKTRKIGRKNCNEKKTP